MDNDIQTTWYSPDELYEIGVERADPLTAGSASNHSRIGCERNPIPAYAPREPIRQYFLTLPTCRGVLGGGTPARLQRHARLDELDAIRISYLHADHSADPLTAYYGALSTDVCLAAPIPLYGPADASRTVKPGDQ